MGKKLEKKGVPSYMMTLADMWSLLLIFFIMLFAMSQIDATKFQEVKGSVKTTFGYNQTRIQWGPPPGFSIIEGRASSDLSGTDIIFDRPANNSILDPQLASLKMQACDRQLKKEAKNAEGAKKNERLVRSVLAAEINEGLVSLSRHGAEVSLIFPAHIAFRGGKLATDMRKAILKFAHVLDTVKGVIVVRNFIPADYVEEHRNAYAESSTRSSEIVSALLENPKVDADRIQIGSLSNSRAPASVKKYEESSRYPFFEVSVVKE